MGRHGKFDFGSEHELSLSLSHAVLLEGQALAKLPKAPAAPRDRDCPATSKSGRGINILRHLNCVTSGVPVFDDATDLRLARLVSALQIARCYSSVAAGDH